MKVFCVAALIALCSATSSAFVPHLQDSKTPQAPTKTDVKPTPAQVEKLKAGIRLHDQGNYDDAIALYQEVLAENPDCTTAMYELATSLVTKKDYAKGLEVATRGTEYQSPSLSSFYVVIGSAYDDMNESAKAIDAYKRGIAISPTFLLHFNLALAYERAKNDDDALVNLKMAVRLNPNHASSHLNLGMLLLDHGYTSQGVMALSRFLILESTSPRAGEAYRFWMGALQGSVTTGADGKVNIGVKPSAGTAEGDFVQQDILIGISRASVLSQAQGKTQAQLLVDQLDGWFKMLNNDKITDRSAFAWSYYAPYFMEIQRKGYVEPFVYWVSQRTNLTGVKEWVADPANRQRATEFVQWSQQYPWPK